MLNTDFFDNDACQVAQQLLGKVMRHRYQDHWLSCRIIETEAYYLAERASHSSLGYSESRKAMFMPAGTIYMYYARGSDSLNISVQGEGNAVLVKAGYPWFDEQSPQDTVLPIMQTLNPVQGSSKIRPLEKLCSGQTLLCRALDLRVKDWNQKNFVAEQFYIEDLGLEAEHIIQTTRLGIAADRDAHLQYRFIDYEFAAYCTSNPLRKRLYQEGRDYTILR